MNLSSVLRRLVGTKHDQSCEDLLTEESVWEVYESLLGRPPESPAVVTAQLAQHKSFRSFVRVVSESQEYRDRISPSDLSKWSLDERVRVHAEPSTVSSLFRSTAQSWESLGTTDALGSVLTEFAASPADEPGPDLVEFFASGSQEVEAIEARLKRNSLPLLSALDGIELGCGVGRVTKSLAPKLASLVAVDISLTHLTRCRQLLDPDPLAPSVALQHVTSFEALREASSGKSFFYSAIVLQHNAPPVQMAMLQSVFSALKSNAVAMFQFVWAHPSYSFTTKVDGAPDPGQMEMHAVPLSAVLRLLEQEQFSVVSAEPAGMTNGWGHDIMITAIKRT